MYKELDNGTILHLPTNKIVPNDPFNIDYVNFQEWLKQGNTPIPKYVPLACINLQDFSINWNCVKESLKNDLLQRLQSDAKFYIESQYPDVKQRSDIVDKEYYENFLKLKGLDENVFRQDITQIVTNIYDNNLPYERGVEELLKKYPVPPNTDSTVWNRALIQLLKVAIRTEFIQRVKQEYWNIVNLISILDNVNDIISYEIKFLTRLPL